MISILHASLWCVKASQRLLLPQRCSPPSSSAHVRMPPAVLVQFLSYANRKKCSVEQAQGTSGGRESCGRWDGLRPRCRPGRRLWSAIV